MRRIVYETKAWIHLSQWGELIYGAQSRIKKDYYVYPHLSLLVNEHWSKENGGKKSFS